MLPLDMPSEELILLFEKHGLMRDDIDIALSLDMDVHGRRGKSWIVTSVKNKKLYRLSTQSSDASDVEEKAEDFTLFSEHPWENTSGFYVDNFISGNRWLYRDENNETQVMGFCSNTCKKRLFAFIDVTERLMKDTEVKDDDQIFEQFHAVCPKCHRPYKDQNNKICEYCNKKSATFMRILSYLKDFKLLVAVSLFCQFFSSFLSLVSPYITGTVFYDRIIPKDGDLHLRGWIFAIVAFIVGIDILGIVNGIIKNRITHKMATRMVLKMKTDVFRSMQSLSLSFYNNNQTGKLINNINGDAEQVRSFCVNDVPTFLYHTVLLVGLTIFLFILNWKLTLIIYLPIPIVVLILKKGRKRLWPTYEKYWKRSASLNAMMNDSLNGIRVVKAFAKEGSEAEKFAQKNSDAYKAWSNINAVELTVWPIIGLLIAFSSKAIWGAGGLMVMSKEMTYGEFSAYFSYVGMIMGPIFYLTDSFMGNLIRTANSAQRMFKIMDTESEVKEAEDPVDLDTTMQGKFEMRGVSFSYTPNRPILKDVNLIIHPGDHIGLVGHTGAGKTTIANLISRLYDPDSGQIFIDDTDIKKVKTSSLRKNIGMVSQEVYLFRGTILENIRYAKPDATFDEVVHAAKMANAHDFIMRLGQGYETRIASSSLSGGEKQRISIARALLLDPKILILDEATAAMDTETERLIQDALDVLTEGRTTITIAHRLSTLKNCNYLYVIEDGKIAEEGNHYDLIAKKGTYYKLYTLQNESMKRVMMGI